MLNMNLSSKRCLWTWVILLSAFILIKHITAQLSQEVKILIIAMRNKIILLLISIQVLLWEKVSLISKEKKKEKKMREFCLEPVKSATKVI